MSSDQKTPDSDDTDSIFKNDRVQIPGRAAVHDKRSPVEDKIDHYACPFCEFTATAERTVRVHITQSDDSVHENRNAFLDTIVVHAKDKDGDILQNLHSPGTTNFEGEEATTLLPEGVKPGTKYAAILEHAIKNPTASAPDISEAIYGRRDRASYVYDTLDKYLVARPTNDPKQTSRKSYGNLSEKQQRCIDAICLRYTPEDVENDDLNIAQLSRDALVSYGYPRDVLESYSHVLAHRRKALADGADPLVHDESPLHDTDLLDSPASVESTPDSSPDSTPESQDDPTTDTQTDQPVAPSDDMILVARSDLQRFTARLDAMRGYAEDDREHAPKGSTQQAAAAKALHVIDETAGFLEQIATSQDPEAADE